MYASLCFIGNLKICVAGRLSSNASQSGDILINGHKRRLAYGASTFLSLGGVSVTPAKWYLAVRVTSSFPTNLTCQ